MYWRDEIEIEKYTQSFETDFVTSRKKTIGRKRARREGKYIIALHRVVIIVAKLEIKGAWEGIAKTFIQRDVYFCLFLCHRCYEIYLVSFSNCIILCLYRERVLSIIEEVTENC